ncbi:MAG: Lrp/AsnC family transcriptional regulator [Deltaproteobacteria bacterium]|jgi:DNA-binding Lrp family transcriptional regulator|nr:Lrp/AsnC family transcriptional regulator [Deltaproteobacteria bacterium]
MKEILNLLQNDARLSAQDIADLTNKSVAEVQAIIKRLEADGVILKYTAIINSEKLEQGINKKDKCQAVIEVQITTERGYGFDVVAERIYRFPQVKSLYLMSGSYDLQVIIEGESLKEIAFFVAGKLATLSGVKSTKTHFILKTYKENDVIYVDAKKDIREGVSA